MQRRKRTPSRWMPAPAKGRLGVTGWVMLGLLGIFLIYVCVSEPWFFVLVISPVVLTGWIGSIVEARRERRIADERSSESICTFARSLDCRQVDTWIVRAVFEEMREYVEFPVRAEDRIKKDLRLDREDVDSILETVAERIARSLHHCEVNPYFDRIRTVGDLVAFLAFQPRCVSNQACR